MVSPPSGQFAAVVSGSPAGGHADLPAAVGEFVRIPSISPAFDAGSAERGALEAAVALARPLAGRPPAGCHDQQLSLPARTPLLLCDIPASPGTGSGKPGRTGGPVLMYGHLDKQAGRTRGRARSRSSRCSPTTRCTAGCADDGYAPFLAGAVIEELRRAGVAHPRVILLLETSEESSSANLPFYLDGYGELLGDPSLVICLDGFVPDDERLWATVSMRGILVGDLQVGLLEQGVHSGIAGGCRRVLLPRASRAA